MVYYYIEGALIHQAEASLEVVAVDYCMDHFHLHMEIITVIRQLQLKLALLRK